MDNHSNNTNELVLEALPLDFIEHLDFSEVAKQVEALKASIVIQTESNEMKLKFLKEEIASGRYQIQSECIASRMLEFAPTHQQEDLELA